eukprot:Skav218777  [mRNA]  locus=scaffold1372:398189:403861:- [translate_table: standard]
MPLCTSPKGKTPLERYAESLCADGTETCGEFRSSQGCQAQSPTMSAPGRSSDTEFPMYTLPAEKLLEMTEVKPHEELLSEGDNSVNMAAASGSLDAITTLLEVAPDLDISRALHSAVILQGGSSAVVVSLVEAMADVDGPYRASGGIVALVNRVKGRAPPFIRC